MGELNKKTKKNEGMTYIELIVVLSIFSLLSSVALFNYGAFQDKIDIKNLGSDIALKIVEAQKSAVSGAFSTHTLPASSKPSFGVYLYSGSISNQDADNKDFIYFADLNNNNSYDDVTCSPTNLSGECLDKVRITKNNSISELKIFGTGAGCPAVVTALTVVFKRPDYSAIINSNPSISCSVSYAQITVTSPKGTASLIKLYPSGRIQVN